MVAIGPSPVLAALVAALCTSTVSVDRGQTVQPPPLPPIALIRSGGAASERAAALLYTLSARRRVTLYSDCRRCGGLFRWRQHSVPKKRDRRRSASPGPAGMVIARASPLDRIPRDRSVAERGGEEAGPTSGDRRDKG